MEANVTSRRLLTIRETAERLAVSQRTVQRLLKNGALPAFRVGGSVRISEDELERWLYEGPEAA